MSKKFSLLKGMTTIYDYSIARRRHRRRACRYLRFRPTDQIRRRRQH
ncbi:MULTISPECIES: hypothetical protein [unclassified Corynebacterium]|nr:MULTISPECIES: hypothetical protein [unclassified Corynebacterium]